MLYIRIARIVHECRREGTAAMTRGIVVWVLLMGLVSLEVCRWRIGVPLVIVWVSLLGLGGLLWVLVFNIFGNDKRHGNASGLIHR